jgi:crossover junction endodeoxyribonuclease RuvC
MRMAIGIDPGNTGAIAVVTALPSGSYSARIYDMPLKQVKPGKVSPTTGRRGAGTFEINVSEVIYLLHKYRDRPVYLEKVWAMNKSVGASNKHGAQSSFNFGTSYGVLWGTASAFASDVVRVAPVTWKSKLGLCGPKDNSRVMAAHYFPEQASMFSRKKDDGRAEAALIGLYGLLDPLCAGA